MPADTTDIDNHVVNIVWLPEKEKWAMIDTDMGYYVTNQKGLTLSLEEMCWNKVNDVPMKYNSIKEEKADSTYYSHYMSKNLYWFVCKEISSYDIVAGNPYLRDRNILLVPTGYQGY